MISILVYNTVVTTVRIDYERKIPTWNYMRKKLISMSWLFKTKISESKILLRYQAEIVNGSTGFTGPMEFKGSNRITRSTTLLIIIFPYRHSIGKCFYFHRHFNDKKYRLKLYRLLNWTLHSKANACNIGTFFWKTKTKQMHIKFIVTSHNGDWSR